MAKLGNFVKTIVVDLKDYIEGDAKITFKELSMGQALKLKQVKNDEDGVMVFIEVLPEIIINHTFEDDKGAHLENKKLIEMLSDSMSTMNYIIGEVSNSFFLSANKKEKK